MYEQKQKNKEMAHAKKLSPLVLLQKERIGNVSRPRLTGKVAAIAVGRGKREQTRKNK